MATVKKTIGRLPVYKGDWVAGTYSMLNQVSYLGSTFQSKIDNNTATPATVVNNALQVNANWSVVSNGTAAYLAAERLTAVEDATKANQSDVDKLKPSNAGTTGQVLTKTATGQEWKNSTGASTIVGYTLPASTLIAFDSSFNNNVSYRFFAKRNTNGNSYIFLGLANAHIRYATNITNANAVFINGSEYAINSYVGNYLDLVITYGDKTINIYINSELAYTQNNVSINNFGNIITLKDKGVESELYIVQKFDSRLTSDDVKEIWRGGKVIGSQLPSFFSSAIGKIVSNTLKTYSSTGGRLGVISSTATTDGYYNIISTSKGTDADCTDKDGSEFAAIDTSVGADIIRKGEIILNVKSVTSPTKIKFHANGETLTISSPGIYTIRFNYFTYNVIFVEVGKEIELSYYYKGVNCVANYNQARDKFAIDSIAGKTIDVLSWTPVPEQGAIIAQTIPTAADYITQLAVVGSDVYVSSSLNLFKKITV